MQPPEQRETRDAEQTEEVQKSANSRVQCFSREDLLSARTAVQQRQQQQPQQQSKQQQLQVLRAPQATATAHFSRTSSGACTPYSSTRMALPFWTQRVCKIFTAVLRASTTWTTSFRSDRAQGVIVTVFWTDQVFCLNIHIVLCRDASTNSAEKIRCELVSVAKITMSRAEPDFMMVKCHLRRGKHMACCVMYRSDAVLNALIAPSRKLLL